MKHLYHTTLFLVILSTAALAQSFKPVDYWRAGSSGWDDITGMAIDSAGNRYFCGRFNGTVDVDPGPGVTNLSIPAGYSKSDVFLIKTDSVGNLLWAKNFDGTSDEYRTAFGLELDQNGNVYVFGIFDKNIRFEPNGVVWNTYGVGLSTFYSAFLAKFNSSGVLKWGYGWYRSSAADLRISSIKVDASKHIYLTGTFKGTVDFNPLPGANNVRNRTAVGDYDFFVAKIDSNGVVKRTRTNGSSGPEEGRGITLGQNAIYLAGSFSNTIDMDWGTGTSSISSQSATDLFLLKLDTAFNFQWVKSYGGPGDSYFSHSANKDSLMILSGVFNQSIDLDPNPNTSNIHSSNGDFDFFVQMLDSNGNYIWSKSIGGAGRDYVTGFDIDNNYHIYLGGHFQNMVDFDPSPTSDYLLNSNGWRDAFILDIDNNGDFKNAAKFGSNNGQYELEGIQERVIDKHGNSHAVGYVYGLVDLNPNVTVNQPSSGFGQEDMLYIQLEACTNATTQYTDAVCSDRYVLPNGTTVYQSGYYLNLLQSSQGCDSTVGVTVVLNPLPDTTITQTGATFTAQAGLASYQWYNCQTNQPITGETNPSFTATANGSYAVIVSNGTCTDTSACFVLDNIGLHESNLPAISLYPNPTSGMLHIQCAQPWQKAEVLDITGRLVHTQNHATSAIDLSKLPAGIYLVKVYFEEGVAVQWVVKD